MSKFDVFIQYLKFFIKHLHNLYQSYHIKNNKIWMSKNLFFNIVILKVLKIICRSIYWQNGWLQCQNISKIIYQKTKRRLFKGPLKVKEWRIWQTNFSFHQNLSFLLPCIWLELPTCASQKSESCKKYQIYSCQGFGFQVWAKHLKK